LNYVSVAAIDFDVDGTVCVIVSVSIIIKKIKTIKNFVQKIKKIIKNTIFKSSFVSKEKSKVMRKLLYRSMFNALMISNRK